jgi:hypothetical protein
MNALKNLTRSLHLIVFFAGFLPFISIEFKGCESDRINQIRDDRICDSIKCDSLVKSDSAYLKIAYLKSTSVYKSDSFLKFYESKRLSKSKIDSIIHQDSLKRSVSRINKNERIYFSAFDYLINIGRVDFKDLKKKISGFVFVLSIDLIVILSFVGSIFVFVNKNRKYKYLRNISLICLILCVIDFLFWLTHLSEFRLEYGFWVILIAYFTILIIDQMILIKKEK